MTKRPVDRPETHAGGARDAHWTGTNEDASVTFVISIRWIDVPASPQSYPYNSVAPLN